MVLINLQKAFVTTDHDILLKQISIIGFANQAIDWFQTYLANQLFRVSFENNYSKPSSIRCAVQNRVILARLL